MSAGVGVDRERWARLTIFEQMGNSGAEVGRMFSALECGDRDRAIAAIGRAEDLFDATAELLAAQKSPRLREVLRAREEYLRIASDEPFDPDDARSLERYFMHFALAARTQTLRERAGGTHGPDR